MTRYYKTSNIGLAFIASLEGICLSKYLCSANVWTIGVGATRSEIPDLPAWPLDRKITVDEAISLLKTSIIKYENAINKVLTKDVPQYTFDALVSWCYNVGVGWPARATLISRINAGQTGQALYDALMMFKKPPEIVGRRRKEAELLVKGVYAGGGVANLFNVNKKGKPIYKGGVEINMMAYFLDI